MQFLCWRHHWPTIFLGPTLGAAFWRESCGIVQTGRIDPIMSPGSVSGHVHSFAGAQNIDSTSTHDSLLEAACTSCEITVDKSAYWTPQLYYLHTNGSFQFVVNRGMTVYYLPPFLPSDPQPVVAFPPGFMMVAGNFSLRTFDTASLTFSNQMYLADRVTFHCLDSSDAAIPESPFINRTACDQGFRAQILFPSCWDGQHLFAPGSSHVTYQAQLGHGGCPPTHPTLLPLLFYEVLYAVEEVDTSQGGTFVFAQGDPTGFGFHGDFLSGWDQGTLEEAISECLTMQGDADGTVEACAILAGHQNENFPRTCPSQAAVVNETIGGLLPRLPGCNPVSTDSTPRAPNSCIQAPSGFSLPTSSAVNFYSSARWVNSSAH